MTVQLGLPRRLPKSREARAHRGPRRPCTPLLRATRPQHWVKNVLVLAAPAAAGVLLRPRILLAALTAVMVFTVVAAGCYVINDVLDRELDRAHPTKRHRPVAAGALSLRAALTAAVTLLTVGLLVAATQSAALLIVMLCYAGLTLAYAVALKGVAWLELLIVAAGFFLRTLAGAAAAAVPVSTWFLLVVIGAAVLVVVCKRLSELIEVPDDPGSIRPVLRHYRPAHLRLARTAAAILLVLSYAGWAALRPTTIGTALALLSLVPLLIVLSLWVRRTERGGAGAPERLLAQDRPVRLAVLLWVASFTATVLTTGAGR